MNSFQELNLSPSLMRAIQDLAYEKPTQIQAEALPILLGEPTDFLGLAATGTGKTAAFAIPLLERIDPSKREVQGLILCPTRELAMQVAGQINLLGKHLGVKALPVYGGSSYGDQIAGIKRGAMIVVGTPGRVVDHITRGTLDLSEVETLILDEADEMISMGFKDDLEAILSKTPRETSSIWLFSATMSSEVRRVADTYLRDPQQVQVNRTEMLPETIEQLYYKVHEGDKPEILCKLIDAADDFYGLVFCQTKALVADLTQYLKGRGYQVDCLHGDMEQDARERTMKSFRDRRVKLLICTDVASRGLDVKDITHVVNYSLPRELDNYVHRIGRTARSGKTGVAMSLVTPSHRILIARIERMTKSRMEEGRIPSRKELGAKKVAASLGGFLEQTQHTRAVDLMGESWKEALAGMSAEEVAGRFIAAMHPDVFSDRPERSERSDRGERSERGEDYRDRRVPVGNPTGTVIKNSGSARGFAPRGRPAVAPLVPSGNPAVVIEPIVTPAASAIAVEAAAPAITESEQVEVFASPAVQAPVSEIYIPVSQVSSPGSPLLSAASMALELEGDEAKVKAKAKAKKAKKKAAAAAEVAPTTPVASQAAPQAAAPVAPAKPAFLTKKKAAAPIVAPLSAPAPAFRKPWERKSTDRAGYGAKRESYGKREGFGNSRPSFGVGGPGERPSYGGKKPWVRKKPFGTVGAGPTTGFVGRPERRAEHLEDVGLGRAPQERTSPWKSKKRAEGGFAKPTWSKDKPPFRPRRSS